MQSLLRWTSLVAAGVVLYLIGARRLHLHDFNAFILIVLGLAAGVVGAFMATRGEAPPPGDGQDGPNR